MPFWGQASIGLHLNLTLGAPLGPCPTLAPTGSLPAIGTYVRGGATLPLGEIEAELGRQIDGFIEVMGRPPDHVDGHQHVHMLAPVRSLVLRQLGLRDLAGKAWLRDSSDQIWRILARGQSIQKALGLSVLGRGFAADAAAAGFFRQRRFCGIFQFPAGGGLWAAVFTLSRAARRPASRHVPSRLCRRRTSPSRSGDGEPRDRTRVFAFPVFRWASRKKPRETVSYIRAALNHSRRIWPDDFYRVPQRYPAGLFHKRFIQNKSEFKFNPKTMDF